MGKVIFAVVVVFVFLLVWMLCIFSGDCQEEVERDYRRLRENGKVEDEERIASADLPGV